MNELSIFCAVKFSKIKPNEFLHTTNFRQKFPQSTVATRVYIQHSYCVPILEIHLLLASVKF